MGGRRSMLKTADRITEIDRKIFDFCMMIGIGSEYRLQIGHNLAVTNDRFIDEIGTYGTVCLHRTAARQCRGLILPSAQRLVR